MDLNGGGARRGVDGPGVWALCVDHRWECGAERDGTAVRGRNERGYEAERKDGDGLWSHGVAVGRDWMGCIVGRCTAPPAALSLDQQPRLPAPRVWQPLPPPPAQPPPPAAPPQAPQPVWYQRLPGELLALLQRVTGPLPALPRWPVVIRL